MKMNVQSRSFVKQVQVDLLALSDADLFHTIHQWMSGKNPSGLPFDVPENTRLALGYTYVIEETEILPQIQEDVPVAGSVATASWHAPSPPHLRILLTAMDVHVFAEHVIPLAYQSLHTLYPEWYDGVTFNAHLANYLRQISMKRRTMANERNVHS